MKSTFAQFFEEVWGYPAFPWQRHLAERVQDSGWPEVIDVPTGAGKTAALDIALYHLAKDGGQTAPRRIVLVVDRRIIVDQVGERARKLLQALHHGEGKATREVAERLRALVGPDEPLLETAILRGASLRDDAWARRPHVPVLAASTVDQIGSRLLFRGYGVSDSMRPVHAGLVGCDTLLLLDEVHLARPFADVLSQLATLRGEPGPVPRRFGVVQLSATPGRAAADVFQLTAEDRADEQLQRRTGASKPARLERVRVRASEEPAAKRQVMAEQVAKYARGMVKEGLRAVAVVVNRVDTARRAWAALQSEEFDRVLLTGRMRPLDQQAVLDAVRDRVLAGREEPPEPRPLVVVATQCIEAGADFDFDGLISECAALDALCQRFGRLNRRGDRRGRGMVVVRSDQLGKAEDAVYGGALAETWRWLESIATSGEVNFGIDGMAPHLSELGEKMTALLAPHRDAPVVLPAYLDQWAQTNPPPYADPDVGVFLHGIPEGGPSALPDVQVVWRADLTEDALRKLSEGPGSEAALNDMLSAVPPGALEALSLPVWTVKRWLSNSRSREEGADDELADVEGAALEVEASLGSGRPVAIWRGRGRIEVATANAIVPGSIVVVPASYGGVGPHHTFDPEDADQDGNAREVSDLGDAVQLLQRGRPVLRLDRRVLHWMSQDIIDDAFSGLEDEDTDPAAAAREALQAVLAADAPQAPPWIRLLGRAANVRWRVAPAPTLEGGTRWIAMAGGLSVGELQQLLGRNTLEQGTAQTTEAEDEEGSFMGVRRGLDEHLLGVGARARRYAQALGLSPALTASLFWAGRIHDIGKVDRRFQIWLYGGDEVAQLSGPVLAKSAVPRQDAAARRRARARAGYPQGQRHELVSLEMAEGNEALRARAEGDGADWELTLHLVASHHGWCRPVAPAMMLEDAQAQDVEWMVDEIRVRGSTAHGRSRMDSGVVDRFWRLTRRYGWHELAYLEAVLRLADHRQSESEASGTAGP